MKQKIEEFLEFLAAERRLSPNTLAAYKNDLRQFEAYLSSRHAGPLGNGVHHLTGSGNGQVGQSELSRETVAGFFLNLRVDKGYSAATIARKMAAVKSLFQFLLRQGVISHNPTAELGSPEVKKPLPRAISVGDVDLLICSGPDRSLHWSRRSSAPTARGRTGLGGAPGLPGPRAASAAAVRPTPASPVLESSRPATHSPGFLAYHEVSRTRQWGSR